MIISPPFLPKRLVTPATATTPATTEDEHAWLARAMTQPRSRAPGTHAFEGSYPVSAALQWHNGLHLVAPRETDGALPVRVIADGKVIFVSPPTAHEPRPEHPQNYMPDRTVAWTDNGCVIVEHTTDIGASGNQPTRVVFYSLYMHLSCIEAGVKVNSPIYRKDQIGSAGQFHGAQDQLHFEICCDKINLDRLIGRPAAWTETEPPTVPSGDGRTDVVFGEIFIYLPASTPTRSKPPTSHVRARASSDTRSAGETLGTAQWVGIRYDKGQATLRSLDTMGRAVGTPEGRTEIDFEYNLYTEANKRHASYLQHSPPASALNAQSIQVSSSPSGWYELLRFGRNLGPDPLPVDAAHWREIPTATGSLWADLHAAGSCKFSEADFLELTGWNFFSDDETPLDQRCDSVELKRWIRDPDPGNAQRMEPAQLGKRLGDTDVQKRLRRAICNFYSEWDSSRIELFIGWLREPEVGYGLDQEHNWNRFLKYCQALTFANLPHEYREATWRLHPGEFISVMRRCTWLSAGEFLQCMPLVYQTNQRNKNSPVISASLKTHDARTRIGKLDPMTFMKMIRKYGLGTKHRLAHLLAQINQETGIFAWKEEIATGQEYEGRLDLGNNQRGDGIRFKGRGLIQTTGRANYKAYGNYRGTQPGQEYTTEPNNVLLSLRSYEASDTCGLYWVSRRVGDVGVNISRLADRGTTENNLRAITRCINRAEDGLWTGLVARRSHLQVTNVILLDDTSTPNIERTRKDVYAF